MRSESYSRNLRIGAEGVINGAGASARKGSGVAAKEGEGAIGMSGGKVLGADRGDAVEVGEIVDLEIADCARGQLLSGFGADDLKAAPIGETMGSVRAIGIGLGGELGHAVFVMNVMIWDAKEGAEFGVEVWF